MPPLKKPLKLLIFLAIMAISLLLTRNMVITGNIIGIQNNPKIINIGFLGNTSHIALAYRNDQMSYGIRMALEDSDFFINDFKINIINGENNDLATNLNYFKENDVKAILVADNSDLHTLSEFASSNKILVFYPYIQYGLKDYSEFGDYMFAVGDFFYFPTILLADVANNLDMKNVGVIYMKTQYDVNDDTTEIFKETFRKISGNDVLFVATYNTDTKTGTNEIIDLIISRNPETIVMIGYGTRIDDNKNLLFKIREQKPDLKILTLGKYEYLNGLFDKLLVINKDYLPEVRWDYILSYSINSIEIEDADSIHLEKNIKNNDALKFIYRINKSYPYLVEGYISIEIIKNLIFLCMNDTGCMQRAIHENIFDTCLGKVRFIEKGVIIRPYLLEEFELGSTSSTIIKRYNLEDMDSIKNKYDLEF